MLSLLPGCRLLISYANHTKDKAIHVNNAGEDVTPDFIQPVVGPRAGEALPKRTAEGGVELNFPANFEDRHGL